MIDKNTWDEIIKNGAYVQELDWFAIDAKGQLAVFTAVINAPIPDMVKESFETYTKILQQIDSLPTSSQVDLITKQKGEFRHWLNYAEKGLFGFDFQDVHRKVREDKYDLIAKPKNPLFVSALPLMVSESIVRLACEFDRGDVAIAVLM